MASLPWSWLFFPHREHPHWSPRRTRRHGRLHRQRLCTGAARHRTPPSSASKEPEGAATHWERKRLFLVAADLPRHRPFVSDILKPELHDLEARLVILYDLTQKNWSRSCHIHHRPCPSTVRTAWTPMSSSSSSSTTARARRARARSLHQQPCGEQSRPLPPSPLCIHAHGASSVRCSVPKLKSESVACPKLS